MELGSTVGTWTTYAGLTIAMAGGAPWPAPAWWAVGVGLGITIGGLAVTRRSRARSIAEAAAGTPTDGAAQAGTPAAARSALARTVERTRALVERVESAPLEAIAREIETIQAEGPEVVAGAQEALTQLWSFSGYASVMSPLAAAERWLNRAWSAAADGHRPEVLTSVRESVVHAEVAASAMASLDDRGPRR